MSNLVPACLLLLSFGVGSVLLALALGALAFFGAAIVATWWHLRTAPQRQANDLPPVSLLKPLKGLEDELETNLTSFFQLDYPDYEVVFASADAFDPALLMARQVAARFPHVPTRFVLTDEGFGLNPKVANLAGALRAAKNDLVHQSDANVRVQPDYLRKIVGELLAEDASVLTSVVVGVGEKTIGAAMENLQLSAFIAPAMCLVLRAVDITCVCGKSMLFYRTELNRDLGGLESVRDVLCEDFVLGERYKALGKKVLLSPTTVSNINGDCGVERFVGRHGRWLKMRVTLHVVGFIADLLSNPIALAFLALVASVAFGTLTPGIAIGVVSILALKVLADRVALRVSRGPDVPAMPWRYAPLTIVKDLMLLPLWVNAVFSRTVEWRGRRLRFGKDTRLVPIESPAKILETDAIAN